MQSMYEPYITKSLELSETGTLPSVVAEIHGMSGLKFRLFLNSLVSSIPSARYLEIGCWKGSTTISALYNNADNLDKCWVIENWSLFDGPKSDFELNAMRVLGRIPTVFEVDAFGIDPISLNIKDVNIYLYDGGHTEEDHYNALAHYIQSMKEEFIYIVDDWNADHIRKSTFRVINDLKINVLYKREILTGSDCDKDWWNGCIIFGMKK